MPNPIISFRLNPYQIARGLWIIRKLEPNYRLTSPAQIVKLLYIDYLAKMSYGRSDIVPPELVQEIKDLTKPGRKPEINFEDFIQQQEQKEPVISAIHGEQSVIKTVTDFSPPTDWLNEEEE